jgi:hypothetical protein
MTGDRQFVMADLVPAIQVFLWRRGQDVDARHRAGHDAEKRMRQP